MGKRMICTLATMGATAVGAGASAVGLLRHQAGSLRRAFDEDENRPHSTFAEAIAAPRHRDDDDSAALAIIGDSWLCGVDVDAEQAPPTLIGRGLARILGTTVRVQTTARPSALSDDLHWQVDEVLRSAWLSRQLSETWNDSRRFAIISIGTGDIIHPIQATIGIPVLNQAINRLQREGRYTVFVLVCPNLGGLPGLRDPLKTSLRRTSRVLAGSQWLAALAARAVPLRATNSLSGTKRKSLLNESGRFPSELGYAQLSSTLLAAIAERIEAPVVVDRSLDVPEKGESARRRDLVPGPRPNPPAVAS
ncbi:MULTISPECIES: SGNH/GDSL hydrolase family protein [unclassified Brevibacterium]|uniref:SGNH/GDSL hydrolase family protein n=1 Tax=unclassified Brevibacterium TaxID=2614124 RepID=UPI002011AD74|nr:MULTISPECIES: SGNH/GDSL hydrolase family protein [unclassified Brevibacterium]